MSFQIKEMDSLSGTKAHIYSVLFDGDDDTLIEQFFNENEGNEHLTEMLRRIITMANDTGCCRQFFREGEGRLGDGVVALAVGTLDYTVFILITR